jgi:hypothetical protein
MGLGSAAIIGLADARLFAGQCRALFARDIDPIEERLQRQRRAAIDAASAVTFWECALKPDRGQTFVLAQRKACCAMA